MCAPRVRVTGDDAPYGDHFVVWGSATPDERTEDHVYDVMTRVRKWDREQVKRDPEYEPAPCDYCPECGELDCNGESHALEPDERPWCDQ